MSLTCGVLVGMISQPAHPPDGEFQPWSPKRAHDQLDFLRSFYLEQGDERARVVADIALTILQNTTCPHAEDEHVRCFHLLLEHEHGTEEGGDTD